ncbi:MAG: 50S ribosomal protein L3 N(5)-glutamine methyltransferase [Magnetococcales bacterium]|nr:50S ribosomal protein L3 N(5)-glutamine methyltransferase [Magnetococcales bacterium]
MEAGSRTVASWVEECARRLTEAGVCFDNGLQTAEAEAEYLVCKVCGIPFEETEELETVVVGAEQSAAVESWLERRIRERLPLFYMTREAFFAGRSYFVDERVLLPRSRIENLVDDPEALEEWLGHVEVRRILDLGCGCGCLAVSFAERFPLAQVDAADISPGALKVAGANLRRHGMEGRVRLMRSDLFQGLGKARYDLIVTNPPYVSREEFESLPPEYHHEPSIALKAGEDGLDLVRAILSQAPDHLEEGGVLICETGDAGQERLQEALPELMLEWLPFHFGASGVFLVSREELLDWREANGNVLLPLPNR